MNKLLAFAFTSLAAASMTCSCGSNGANKSDNKDTLTFDSVVVDTVTSLVDGKDTPSCDVKISFAFAKGKNATAINQAIVKSGVLAPDYLQGMEKCTDMKALVDTFVTRFISDYKATFAPLYEADREAQSLCSTYSVSHTIEQGHGDIIVYTAQTYQYAGGAHGSYQTLVSNINPKKGCVVTLKDLLVPGGETKMKEMIVEKMQRMAGVKDFKSLQQKGYFMDMEAYIPDNFILGKKAITFVYNSDEIAPHALGEIRVEFPYDELSNILK